MPVIQRLVRLVSAAMGRRRTPSDIRISGLIDGEYMAALEAGKGYIEHKVHSVWASGTPNSALWIGYPFALFHDGEKLAAFLN